MTTASASRLLVGSASRPEKRLLPDARPGASAGPWGAPPGVRGLSTRRAVCALRSAFDDRAHLDRAAEACGRDSRGDGDRLSEVVGVGQVVAAEDPLGLG